MNNEITLVLDILEELKQDCKVISKAQAELRTTIAEKLSSPRADSIKRQEAIQIHLSKNSNKIAKSSVRHKQNCVLLLQKNCPVQEQIVLKGKKPYKSISRKKLKPKSKNINFLFWRHYQSRIRNSIQSLKLCTSSSASNKSL